MGLNFRKSIKIAPGVKLNIGKRGINSISTGVKGARVNIGKKGTRTTVGVPKTGLSYSSYKSHSNKSESTVSSNSAPRAFKIFFWAAVGLLVLLYMIFRV